MPINVRIGNLGHELAEADMRHEGRPAMLVREYSAHRDLATGYFSRLGGGFLGMGKSRDQRNAVELGADAGEVRVESIFNAVKSLNTNLLPEKEGQVGHITIMPMKLVHGAPFQLAATQAVDFRKLRDDLSQEEAQNLLQAIYSDLFRAQYHIAQDRGIHVNFELALLSTGIFSGHFDRAAIERISSEALVAAYAQMPADFETHVSTTVVQFGGFANDDIEARIEAAAVGNGEATVPSPNVHIQGPVELAAQLRSDYVAPSKLFSRRTHRAIAEQSDLSGVEVKAGGHFEVVQDMVAYAQAHLHNFAAPVAAAGAGGAGATVVADATVGGAAGVAPTPADAEVAV